MKLLFDQNLSPRYPRTLTELFPGSAHARDLGLRDADDALIWRYARDQQFAIVSKDSDFQMRSLFYGHPPKFIWLRVGNCSVRAIERPIRDHAAAITAFGASSTEAHLMLP